MERLGDSARSLVIRSYSRVTPSASEFEGSTYFLSAADITAGAALLHTDNIDLLLEAARLRVRSASEGEGLFDTTQLRKALVFIDCASAVARRVGDATALRRSDSLAQVINQVWRRDR
jgi:hypothetical protein